MINGKWTFFIVYPTVLLNNITFFSYVHKLFFYNIRGVSGRPVTLVYRRYNNHGNPNTRSETGQIGGYSRCGIVCLTLEQSFEEMQAKKHSDWS